MSSNSLRVFLLVNQKLLSYLIEVLGTCNTFSRKYNRVNITVTNKIRRHNPKVVMLKCLHITVFTPLSVKENPFINPD